MSVPYDPVTLFFDTFAVLELDTTVLGGAAWPGNGNVLSSPLIDLVDMLPAATPNNNLTFLPTASSNRYPDPRFFLDWYMAVNQEPAGVPATDTMLVMEVNSGSVAGETSTQFVVTCHGPAAKINYFPTGAAPDQPRLGMSGSFRMTGRQFSVNVRTFGDGLGGVVFGAYLKVL